jgi:hypothetical protein
VAPRGQRLGRRLTHNEIAHVVHQTRPKKLKGASEKQVRQQQLGEIGFFEQRALRKVVEAANGRPQDVMQAVTTDDAVEHSVQHVFERQSVARQHQLLEAALVKGYGQLDLSQLKEKLAGRNELVRVGASSPRGYTHQRLLLIRMVNAGLDTVAPISRGTIPPTSAPTSTGRWRTCSPVQPVLLASVAARRGEHSAGNWRVHRRIGAVFCPDRCRSRTLRKAACSYDAGGCSPMPRRSPLSIAV